MLFRMRLLMILGLWSVVAWATAQLQADFSASPTTGCAPLRVSFNNLSPAGSGYSYEWGFGNGSVSTAVNPNTVYVNPGSYTVTLRVQYGGRPSVPPRKTLLWLGPYRRWLLNCSAIRSVVVPIRLTSIIWAVIRKLRN